MTIEIPVLAHNVMREIDCRLGNRSRTLLVGGFVRDAVIRMLRDPGLQPSKDFDFEVHGVLLPELVAALQQIGRVDLVGARFGVIKLTLHGGIQMDVSLPRTDNKVGVRHTDFEPDFDPDMGLTVASVRRDLTINAMAADRFGTVFDPWGGIPDIINGTLRAVSPKFKEDALRVLRLMSFASRLNFTVEPETAQMARELLSEFDGISGENVWTEWQKWARGVNPAAGLQVLIQTGWIDAFPELAAMRGVAQEKAWHPEGDVLTHTILTVARAAGIATRENMTPQDREVFILAAMLHDVGKPLTTSVSEDGRIISHGHARAGAEIATRFLGNMRALDAVVARVRKLVADHMVHAGVDHIQASTVRRLALRLASGRRDERVTVRMLALLSEADASGRWPAPPASPMAEWARMAEELAVLDAKPEPLLRGNDLLAIGFAPGPEIGRVLRLAFERQLDGEFGDRDDAMAFASTMLPKVAL